MGRRCIIEECENTVSDRSRLDACPTCRAAINRWDKRRPAEVLARRRTLTMYHARLAPLIDEDVVELKTKKKRDEYAHAEVVRITTKRVKSMTPQQQKEAKRA